MKAKLFIRFCEKTATKSLAVEAGLELSAAKRLTEYIRYLASRTNRRARRLKIARKQ